MAGSDTLPGAREPDADKAEHSIREVIAGLLSALYFARYLRYQGSDSPDNPFISVDNLDSKGQTQAQNLSETNALPGHSEAEALPSPLEIDVLPESPHADALLEPFDRDGRPGPGNVEALPGQEEAKALPGSLETADSIDSTLPNSPDPTISIKIGDEVIESPLSQLGDTLYQQPPETMEQLRSALHDIDRSAVAPTVEIRSDGQLKFYRDDIDTQISSDFRIREPFLSVEDVEEVEVASVHDRDTHSPGEQSGEIIETAGTREVRQVPVSEAEILAGQNLAQTSTSNPDIWNEQPQVYTVEVDSYGNMQPTQPIASGLEGVAEQVELREAQIIADEYDEALDSRREQSDLRTGGNYASENALTDSGTPDPNSQIIDMLDRACDHCYEPGGRQVISGNYLTVERDGPRLTVTANDDGRVILERTNNGDIRSSMTPADQAILQNGFDVLDQHQRLLEQRSQLSLKKGQAIRTPNTATLPSATSQASAPATLPPTTGPASVPALPSGMELG